MTMNRVNIHEAKAMLSELIAAAADGQRVVICKRNRPVAELVPLASARARARRIGGVPDLAVPAGFFTPLPDDVVDAFDEGLPGVAERYPLPGSDRAIVADGRGAPAAGDATRPRRRAGAARR